MLAERMDEAWRARRDSIEVDSVIRLTDEGLVLGAGTLLMTSSEARSGRSIEAAEARLCTLLAAAHLRQPTAQAINHVVKAAQRWSEGHEGLATMHLALSGLARLERPEADAHRLFLADALLKAGVNASAITDAVDPAYSPLRRYSPDQPRVPAGSGRTSGEWTTGEGGQSNSATPQLSPNAAPPEVNPDSITPAATQAFASVHACKIAESECVTAAYNLAGEADNDNEPYNDISRCRQAGLVCDTMSWIIEDIPGLDYGGVIFPHRGVVIIQKGRLDRYIPPLAGFKTPPFSRHP